MPIYPAEIDPKMGKRFKIVRKHLKLSQGLMANLCEIAQGMVSMVESGKRDIPTSALKNLFIKKNISPSYILAEAGEMEFVKPSGETQVSSKLKSMEADIEILKGEIERLNKKIS